MSSLYFGIDMGGTKCAVLVADKDGNILERKAFATGRDCMPDDVIGKCTDLMEDFRERYEDGERKLTSIGISCGGPLDSSVGIIMAPPNLPNWIDYPIVEILNERFGVPCNLENDANACALAEWKFGAAQGTRNAIFLTFGTGLGAGLILDGRLYSGTNGNAGEVGHVRLTDEGPVGFYKAGSFEGWCSGGGIRENALIEMKCNAGRNSVLYSLDEINAKTVFNAADEGDWLAQKIVDSTAYQLGMGLSMLIDILNPEVIVIGSIYARSEWQLKPIMEEIIAREALSKSSAVCRVLPAALGNEIGDYAAISIAMEER